MNRRSSRPSKVAVEQRLHGPGKGRGGNRQLDIGGDRGNPARIRHPAQLEPAEHQVIHPDEIAFGGVGVVVVHALRGKRTRARGCSQLAERRDHDGSAGQQAALADDISGGAEVGRPGGIEHVRSDVVEGVVVDPQRVVVRETFLSLLGVVSTRSCWKKKKLKEAAEVMIAASLTAMRTRFGAVVEMQVTNHRWESLSKRTRGSDMLEPARTGEKKNIRIGIEGTEIAQLVEDLDASVDGDERLGRSGGSHGIGGNEARLGNLDGQEVHAGRLGKRRTDGGGRRGSGPGRPLGSGRGSGRLGPRAAIELGAHALPRNGGPLGRGGGHDLGDFPGDSRLAGPGPALRAGASTGRHRRRDPPGVRPPARRQPRHVFGSWPFPPLNVVASRSRSGLKLWTGRGGGGKLYFVTSATLIL